MLTQKETIEIIKPHYMKLLSLLSKARKRLNLVNPERHALRKTTVANFYRDLAVDEARLVFDGRQAQGISLLDNSDGSFYIEFAGFPLGIPGAAWMRIKKVDSNYLTSNIPTKKAEKFNSQLPIGYTQQPYLDGVDWSVNPKMLQPTHINFGHQWNELGTDIQDVVLTCPENSYSLAWIEKIGDSDAMEMGVSDSENNVADFPIRLEVTNQKPKRIKAKNDTDTDKEKVKKDGTWS
jgi:hypothetical protein